MACFFFPPEPVEKVVSSVTAQAVTISRSITSRAGAMALGALGRITAGSVGICWAGINAGFKVDVEPVEEAF